MPKTKHSRTSALRAVGWCREDAEQLAAIERLLAGASAQTDGQLFRAGVGIGAGLLREPVFCGAICNYVQPEHAVAWRRLAELVGPGLRDNRFAYLADLAEANVRVDDTLREAAAAEVRGEFAEALQLLRSAGLPEDHDWVVDLLLATEFGSHLRAQDWGRWLCGAAARRAALWPEDRAAVVRLARVALSAGGASAALTEQALQTFPLANPVIADAVLFDLGGLARYVAELSPEVLALAPGLTGWPGTAPRVLRIERSGDTTVSCRDLVTGEAVDVSGDDLGDQPAGTTVLARVVTVEGLDAGWLPSRPFELEQGDVAGLIAVLARDGTVEERLAAFFRGAYADWPRSLVPS